MSELLDHIDLRFDLFAGKLAEHTITEGGCWEYPLESSKAHDRDTRCTGRSAPQDHERKPRFKATQDIVLQIVAPILIAMNFVTPPTTEAQSIQQWAVAPGVKYDPTGSPYSQFHVEQAIEEAIWAWSSRIPGLDIVYVGLTLAPVERAVIKFKWADLDEYLQLTNNLLSKGAEQTWTYIDTGTISRSVIHLNTAYFKGGIDACEMTTLSHEFGHALGLNGHSPEPDDLMYWAPAHCRYMPTDNDLVMLGHEPTTCHSVMTRESDIYVPDLSAFLEYQGGGVWILAHMKVNPHEQGCNQVAVDYDGVITLTGLRSLSGNLTRLELAPIADNTWSLQWAE